MTVYDCGWLSISGMNVFRFFPDFKFFSMSRRSVLKDTISVKFVTISCSFIMLNDK